MSFNKVILLLGSNLGNKEANLHKAIENIEKQIGKVVFFTEIDKTAPVEFVSKNIFCNIALCIHTDFSPFLLLKGVKKIEKEMGRTQDSFIVGEYTDRIIDIDIVKFSNIVFKSEKLEIPHQKHLFERDFSKRLLTNLNEKIKTQI